MVEPRARIASAEKVGLLLSDAGKPRPELLKRLGVASKLLSLWYEQTADSKADWWPKIDLTRGNVENATLNLKSGDGVSERAAYKEAGDSFYALWLLLSQSEVAPSMAEKANDLIDRGLDAAKQVAGISIGTIVMIAIGYHLLTKGGK